MTKEEIIKEKIIKILRKADMEDGCRDEWFEEWATQILSLFLNNQEDLLKKIDKEFEKMYLSSMNIDDLKKKIKQLLKER